MSLTSGGLPTAAQWHKLTMAVNLTRVAVTACTPPAQPTPPAGAPAGDSCWHPDEARFGWLLHLAALQHALHFLDARMCATQHRVEWPLKAAVKDKTALQITNIQT
jgi:hypothetical protein